MANFIEKYIKGEILTEGLDEGFDDAVKEWHSKKPKISLHEFLGMTKEDFNRIVERPESLGTVVNIYKNK